MKIIVVCVAFIALASAAKTKKPIAEYFSEFAGEKDIHLITEDDNRPPVNFQGDVMKAKTTRFNVNSVRGGGKFNYNFETENGINVAQIGKLKDSKTFVVTGSYTYTGANGKRYRVRYTADEFGYHPVTELDDQPEVEIKPKPTPAPLQKLTFAPFTSFTSGNSFNNANNQNQKGALGNSFNNGNSQIQKGGANDGYVNGGYEQGLNNQQASGNGQGFNNGQNGQNGNNGNNGASNGFNSGNGIGSSFGSGFGQNGNDGLNNGLNNGLSNGLANGLNNGLPNELSGRFGLETPTFNNGFNTINGYAQFDRTGKSLEQTELIYNSNFVSAPVPQQQAEPDRLYLPAVPTYLPPTRTYLPSLA